MKKLLLFVLGVFLFFQNIQSAVTLLHDFAGGSDDGKEPYGLLTLSGTTLYGMTSHGGDNDMGTIFKIEANGTGFTLLHEFAGGNDDGSEPDGSLIVSGTTLYGMTFSGGGDTGNGTIFKIETNGTGFVLLHKFAGGANDGSFPFGSLVLFGTTLYGMTGSGGDYSKGTLFKIETNGTGFSLLHEFAGGADDGASPKGTPLIFGTTIYGMTGSGGDDDYGTIFKIETSGTGYSILHEFTGSPDDGQTPPWDSALVLSGTKLFGITGYGGSHNSGVIFQIETDGTGYSLVNDFKVLPPSGQNPKGSLLIYGSTLLGMTYTGNTLNGSVSGTVFKIDTDGTDFHLIQGFKGGIDDGGYPYNSGTLSGTTLYGMTNQGGDSNYGTIFSASIELPTITFQTDGTLGSTLTGNTSQSIDYGSNCTAVTANAPIGYHFANWTGTGAFSSTDNPLTVINVIKNMTITANFAVNQYSVNFQTNGVPGATLTGNTSQVVVHGSNCTPVTANSPSGYHFLNWTGTGDFTSNENPVTVTNVTNNMTITANIILDGPPLSGDFNGDNVTDLVWRHYAADGANCVWLMNAATGAAWEEEAGIQEENAEGKYEEESSVESVETEETDSETAEADFFNTNYFASQFPIPEYNGPVGAISILQNVSLPALPGNSWKICGTGDFDSDGKVDILWRYYGTGGSNAVWLMDGTNKTSAVALPAQTDVKWEIVGTGDFNSDNKVDILWRHKGNGKNMIWLMNGLTRSSIVNLPTQSNLTWKIGGCGDFNGDGKTDILWRFQGAGGKNQVWLMNGTARQSIVTIKAETNTKWQIAGVGDFNKDGKSDIIWRNYSTGGANRIWIMNNTVYVRTETLPAVADLKWKIEN